MIGLRSYIESGAISCLEGLVAEHVCTVFILALAQAWQVFASFSEGKLGLPT